jgi:thiosulfate dehydrogenase (quinone) large subunit
MNKNKEIAILLLRVALGINIFLHGFVRFFAYEKFVENTAAMFQDSLLPDFLVRAFVYSIPVLEAVIGFLVIVGLFTLPSLIAGLLMMVFLMIGMCVLQKWDIVGLQMNYILFYAILIFTLQSDKFSIDQILRKKR